MIKKLVAEWEKHRAELVAWAMKAHPSYAEMVKEIVERTSSDEYVGHWYPSSERITEIDHGEWQGTLVYVVGAKGYQPGRYWYVMVGYGSCSGCDSQQDACDRTGEDAERAWTRLLLSIVQEFREMGREMGGES